MFTDAGGAYIGARSQTAGSFSGLVSAEAGIVYFGCVLIKPSIFTVKKISALLLAMFFRLENGNIYSIQTHDIDFQCHSILCKKEQ